MPELKKSLDAFFITIIDNVTEYAKVAANKPVNEVYLTLHNIETSAMAAAQRLAGREPGSEDQVIAYAREKFDRLVMEKLGNNLFDGYRDARMKLLPAAPERVAISPPATNFTAAQASHVKGANIPEDYMRALDTVFSEVKFRLNECHIKYPNRDDSCSIVGGIVTSTRQQVKMIAERYKETGFANQGIENFYSRLKTFIDSKWNVGFGENVFNLLHIIDEAKLPPLAVEAKISQSQASASGIEEVLRKLTGILTDYKNLADKFSQTSHISDQERAKIAEQAARLARRRSPWRYVTDTIGALLIAGIAGGSYLGHMLGEIEAHTRERQAVLREPLPVPRSTFADLERKVTTMGKKQSELEAKAENLTDRSLEAELDRGTLRAGLSENQKQLDELTNKLNNALTRAFGETDTSLTKRLETLKKTLDGIEKDYLKSAELAKVREDINNMDKEILDRINERLGEMKLYTNDALNTHAAADDAKRAETVKGLQMNLQTACDIINSLREQWDKHKQHKHPEYEPKKEEKKEEKKQPEKKDEKKS